MWLMKIVFLCLFLAMLSTVSDAKILFDSSQHEGIYGIYVMDDDGSNITPLTESPELRPVSDCWSPDGRQIVFTRRATKFDTRGVLFLMNADGTNIRQLTENDGSSIGRASFSPDGKSLVFNRSVRINEKTLKISITVLDIETGRMEDISDVWGVTCDWSPDGKHIVFSEPIPVGGGGGTIWIIGADGHNPRRLIPPPPVGEVLIHRSQPRWSPDGRQIAFLQRKYTWKPGPGGLIHHAYRYFICDRTGGNLRKLRVPKDWDWYDIDWMDGGKSVVFSAAAGMLLNQPIPEGFLFPSSDVYKYDLETNEITRLTNFPGWVQSVDWISDKVLSVSPLGKKSVSWGVLKGANKAALK